MKQVVYIGVGSNVGDRLENILKAIRKLSEMPGGKIIAKSSLYETRPFGVTEQENFYNLAIAYETDMAPQELFSALKGIEKEVGRKKRERWHAREIDLDILLFGELIIKTESLTIPHPGMIYRDFVILPLLEINNNITDPETGIRLSDINIPEQERCVIRKINQEVFNNE